MRDFVPALSLSAVAAVVTLAAFPCLAQRTACPLSDVDCVIFIPLGDLTGGNYRSEVYGLSQDGLVAVGLSDSNGAPSSGEAFRWENGTMEALGSLPGGSTTSRANGVRRVENDEWIVGASSSSATGSSGLEAFLYSTLDASFTAVGFLAGGSSQSSAAAIAAVNTAVVVGQSYSEDVGSCL